MLGFSDKGNNWKLMLGNFLTTFTGFSLVQIKVYLDNGNYPNQIQFCNIFVTALIGGLVETGLYRKVNETIRKRRENNANR